MFMQPGRFIAPKVLLVGSQEFTADDFVVCVGSQPVVPDIPGLSAVRYHTSDTIMRIVRQPRGATHLPHPRARVRDRGPRQPQGHHPGRGDDLQGRLTADPEAGLAADTDRHRLQGRPRLRLGTTLEMVADDTPDGADDAGVSVLLARRHRYTGTVSFFRCWSPAPVPLAKLVSVVCCRWRIEEDFQTVKNTTSLDKGQVTTWTSWHRWSTAAGRLRLPRRHRRLLRLLILPTPRRDTDHILHWSTWRRRHQHRARQAHQRWHAYADTAP
ncbi:hypothetical protein ABT215_30150 [Streptomyces sp900105755]|uniref:hypothetical protein n=1 Tax=Streptomyces sp. 900105755 TaxID=3154389 RepID=UPI00331D8B2A